MMLNPGILFLSLLFITSQDFLRQGEEMLQGTKLGHHEIGKGRNVTGTGWLEDLTDGQIIELRVCRVSDLVDEQSGLVRRPHYNNVLKLQGLDPRFTGRPPPYLSLL